MTTLHPMHPAAWVVREVARAGWEVYRLLTFTRASTILLVSRDSEPPVVMKAGFGSNHVLAELDDDVRAAAYGVYWYQEMTAQALARLPEHATSFPSWNPVAPTGSTGTPCRTAPTATSVQL